MTVYLFWEVKQAVFKEHVFSLAPGAIDDDNVMFLSTDFLTLHQFLQIFRFGARIQNERFTISTNGSQLWIPEKKKTIEVGGHQSRDFTTICGVIVCNLLCR